MSEHDDDAKTVKYMSVMGGFFSALTVGLIAIANAIA